MDIHIFRIGMTPSQWAISPNNTRIKFYSILVAILLAFYSHAGYASISVSGQLGTTTTSATFTLNYSCTSGFALCHLEERSGSTWQQISTNASSVTLTRPIGSHEFRVRRCTAHGTPTGPVFSCSVQTTRTVNIVRNPTSSPATRVNGSAASTSNTGSFDVSFNGVTYGDYYLFQQRLNGGSWSTLGTTSPGTVTYTRDDGVWEFRVQACRGGGGCANWGNVARVTVARQPDTPSSVSIGGSSPSQGLFSISWPASSGNVTRYELQRQLNGGSWAQVYSGTSRNRSFDITQAGDYRHRVRACNQVSTFTPCSGWRTSSIITVAVPEASPGGLSAPSGSGNGSYAVNWNSVANTSSYTLQERADGGNWSTVQNDGSRSKDFSGQSDGVYEYRVRACNRVGCSGYSSSVTVNVARAPGTPATINVPPVVTNGEFNVSWGSSSGTVSAYELYQRSAGGNWSRIYRGTDRSRTITLSSEGEYGFQVRACQMVGTTENCSGYRESAWVTAEAPQSAPTIEISQTTSHNGSFSVSWSDVENVDHYELEEKVGDGAWNHSQSVGVTTRSYTGKGNNRYRYRVRACNRLGCASRSAVVHVDVAITPGVPSGLSVPGGTTDGEFTVGWNAPSGRVTEYRLQQQLNGGSWTNVQMSQSTATSQEISVDAEGNYRYRIRACNRVESYTRCSGYSSTSGVVVASRPAGTGFTGSARITNTSGGFTLGWHEAENYSHYELQERVDNGSWGEVSLSDTEITQSDIRQLGPIARGIGKYDYRINVCNRLGCSGYSGQKTIEVTPIPPNVALLTVSASESDIGRVDLAWSRVSPEYPQTTYELQYVVNNGGWQAFPGYDSQSDSASLPQVSGGQYKFRIRARNTVGESVRYSSEWNQEPAPVSRATGTVTIQLPDTSDSGEYEVSWQFSHAHEGAEATYYKIEEKRGSNTEAIQTSDNTLERTQLVSGVYTYTVRACNAYGCSDPSAEKAITVAIAPSQPGAISAPSVSDGNYTVSWGASDAHAQLYRVREISDGGVTTEDELTGTSLPRSGMAEGSYRYEVRACNGVGNFEACSSPAVKENIIVTRPSTPGGVTLDAVGESGVPYLLAWNSTDVTTRYEVQETVDGVPTEGWISVSDSAKPLTQGDEGRYGYRVRACNAAGCSSPSSERYIQIIEKPAQPGTIQAESPNDGRYQVTWVVGNGSPTHYRVQRRPDGSEWGAVVTETQALHSVEGLAAGEYQYRVTACRTQLGQTLCSSPRMSSVFISAPPIGGPATVTGPAENDTGRFTIHWGSVENVRYYDVEERIGTSSWSSLGTTEGASYDLSGREENSYSYRVLACNDLGCEPSEQTATVIVRLTPDSPGSLAAEASFIDGKTELSWGDMSNFPGVEDYEVQQRRNSSSWSQSHVFSGAGGQWPTAVSQSGNYEYQIRACRSAGGQRYCSEWQLSNSVGYAVPEVPVVTLPAYSDDGQYTVSWTGSEYAGEFTVEENGGQQVRAESYLDFDEDNAKSMGVYTYRVRGCNVLGCSDFSDRRSITVRGNQDGSGSGGGSPGGGQPDDGSDGASTAYTGDLSPMPAAPSTLGGAISGSHRVTESGAATYNIPMEVPRGTAGVTPELSFHYSSQSGNGLLGQGWSLGGLSSISRCRQTLYQDGIAKPITMTKTDRFCLDGQRLILTNGSDYGAVGARYRTEIDSQVVVHSKGGSLGNPDHFEVHGRDGSTRVYGQSSNSKVNVGGATLTWSQSSFRDSVDNRITYTYEGGALTGHRISRIEYAYSSTGGSGTAMARIDFDYGSSMRPDSLGYYISGQRFRDSHRLEEVKIYNNSGSGMQQYRRYSLIYHGDNWISTDNVSRLREIRRCVDASCYSQTNFHWNQEYIHPESSEDRISLILSSASVQEENDWQIIDYSLADVTGNGELDIIWIRRGVNSGSAQQLQYAVSDGEGSYTKVNLSDSVVGSPGTTSTATSKIHTLDYNGNGRQDVLVYRPWGESGRWRLYLSVPQVNGSWRLEYKGALNLPNSNVTFADMDGDGLADAIYGAENAMKVRYLRPRSEASKSSSQYYHFDSVEHSYSFSGLPSSEHDVFWRVTPLPRFGMGDFDGSGRMGIIARVEQRRSVYVNAPPSPGYQEITLSSEYKVFTFNGEQFELYDTLGETSDISRLGVVDINGDGLSDVTYFKNGLWRYRINEGDGLKFRKSVITPFSGEAEKAYFVDLNSNGYADVVYSNGPHLYYQLWNSETETFQGDETLRLTQDSIVHDFPSVFVDMDNDGWVNLVYFDASGAWAFQPSWHIIPTNRAGNASYNLVHAIEDGGGRRTSFTYDRLTRTEHYRRLDVGQAVTEVLDEECIHQGGPWASPGSGNRICYTPELTYIDTADFYRAINDPFSDVPEGNDKLDQGDSPVLEIMPSIPVVTYVETSNPSYDNPNGTAVTSYYYDQLRVKAGGRGSLGFKRLSMLDHQSGIATTTSYRQDWPFIGSPLITVRKIPKEVGSAVVLSESSNTWTLNSHQGSGGSSYHQIYIGASVEESFELVEEGLIQGDLLSRITTETKQDSEGNVEELKITSTDGDSDVHVNWVVNEYGDSDESRRLGRLSRVSTFDADGNEGDRVSEFAYNADGLLKTEKLIVQGSVKQITEHSYDGFGNREMSTITGIGDAGGSSVERQGEKITYINGRYVSVVKNAKNHVVRQVLERNRFGGATRVADIHGTETTIFYDALGREYGRSDDTGAWAWFERRRCGISTPCPTTGHYRIEERVAGGGVGYTYVDRLGRTVRESRVGFNGALINVDTEYNFRGNPVRVSNPYKEGESVYWTEKEYDFLGRLVEVVQPDGIVGMSKGYDGFTQTTTNALGHTKYERFNVIGERIEVSDSIGGVIAYEYDEHGNLHKATSNGVTVTMCYDGLGRKVAMHDPDKGGFAGNSNHDCSNIDPSSPPAGWWGYVYNGVGDLIEQRDPKGQMQVMTYDILGRRNTRTDYYANNALHSFTRWHYDGEGASGSHAGELGQLTQVVQSSTLSNASCDDGSNYCRVYSYDSFGRQWAELTLPPDGDVGYINQVSFDPIGRPYVQRDAMDGLVHGASGTVHQYNEYGYRVSTLDLGSGDKLRETRKMDAWGNVTEEYRGNGLTTRYEFDPYFGRLTSQVASVGASAVVQDIEYDWDDLGNLRYRHNRSARVHTPTDPIEYNDLRESYCYDGLNRLIKTYRGSLNGNCTIGVSNQDVRYGLNGNIEYKADVGAYHYGDGAGPHAVAEAGGVTYSYDANGNQIGSSDGRQITYSPFDKPVEISKDGHVTTFTYGPDRQRYQRTDKGANEFDPVKTTTYLGGIERIEVQGSGSIVWRRQVAGVIYVTETGTDFHATGSSSSAWLYHDHLGSLDLVTNRQGIVIEALSFDPWGQRRNAQTWNSLSITQLTAFNTERTNRGYTGHEHLDEVGLIHMNGRVYDPRLARFLQADPFIQAPGNTQSFNRYSYVWNNPLNATDPSGYFLDKLVDPFKSVRREISRAIGPEISQVIVSVGSMFCGPGAPMCMAAGTYDVGRAHGLNQRDALRGAAVSGASVWAFMPSGGIPTPTAGDVAWRIGVNIVAAEDPNIGQALMFVTSNWRSDFGPGDWARNAVGSFTQYKAQQELSRHAARIGLTLQELNLLLGMNSKIGLGYAGTSVRDSDNGDHLIIGGFGWRKDRPLRGMIWDVNDTLLNVQGLLDAVSLSIVGKGQIDHIGEAHSLGAGRANVLQRQGFFSSGENIELKSLPGYAFAASGISGTCINADIICGGALLTAFRPGIKGLQSPGSFYRFMENHAYDNY